MPSLILGTAGHIDHGKTALVRALTGVDTDRLEEEKRRGISIDLGFAPLGVDGFELGIVDVPGHERFIRNMLAGASGVDVAMLVVAADDSVMPQTREHLAILGFLRVRHGLVALTKIDLAEPAWLDLVEADVRDLVAGTFLEGAPIVRTSATSGAGLDELRAALAEVCRRVEPRGGGSGGGADGGAGGGGLFRMPVDRAFALQGLGTVATGSVWSGRARVGDELEWLPAGRRVRVRGLQSHGRDVETIERGRRAALHLGGVHHREIRRGHEIASPGFLRASRRLTARLRVLPDAPRSLRHRDRVRLHLGTQEVVAAVVLLEGGDVPPGATRLARLNCAEPVVCRCRQPFVVRSVSPVRTVGGGTILQPIARRASRRRADAHLLLERLDADDAPMRAAAAIRLYGAEPWTDLDLCRDADVEPDGVPDLLRRLDAAGETIDLGVAGRPARTLHRAALDEVLEAIGRAVARQHEASPLEAEVPRSRLAAALPRYDGELIERGLDLLVERGILTGGAGGAAAVAMPGFAPRLTGGQQRWREQVLETLRSGGFRPPDAGELARAIGARDDQLRPLLDLCVQQGDLVRLPGGLLLHRHWADELERAVVERLRRGPGLAVTEIKDLLDTTRKYAVPMCEHLDRIGVTVREGDVRVLGRATKRQGDEAT